jgi:tetratricopeptide (TPR) repeat protein
MKRATARHDWLVSPHRDDVTPGDDAAAWLSIDAHRNLRGPFTAAGGVVRALIDDANKGAPELVATHLVTLLLVAPEVAQCVAVPAEVRDASLVSREGNPASWMRRVANGVADFILGTIERQRPLPATLVFTNVDHADPVDQEFIATLLRRADPKTLRLCICTASVTLAPPLAAALAQYARRRRQKTGAPRLGAIAFHHQQADIDADKLLAASRSCLDMACYDAALESAVRGRQMLADAPQGKTYADLTRQMLFALLLLGRYDEVERLAEDLLAHSVDPALLAHATYAMAILNARLYEKSRRDYDAAKSWIEKSQAFTDATPASPTRAVNAAFLMNTLALVEMRKGHVDAARQQLLDALALMARDAPDLYRNESAILLHNMARLELATGRPDLAIGHLTTLLSQQPGDSSAWFDRGRIHQRAGRQDAALGDYDAAIRWEPAHAEAHFNRAQTLVALNRRDEAIDAYARVIVLQPDYADARLNRAILLCERGDLAPARDEIGIALQAQPNDARMLCTLGLIEMRTGDHDAACNAFDRSIAADPNLADPWANRAATAYKRGDLSGAVKDLTRALALREDAAILCNRAKVHEARRQWQKAIADYARARTLAGVDIEAIDRRSQRCLEAIRQTKPRRR